MTYDRVNEVKANFDNVYTAPTPHSYLRMMTKHGYEISDQARPYCAAAVELLRECNGTSVPVQMLDVGCSYGIGAAVVKYGRSFKELTRFVIDEMPESYDDALDSMRNWLNGSCKAATLKCIGLDSSAPAIRFAVGAGLLEGGIPRDLENGHNGLTEKDRKFLRNSNLMISTGAFGYVAENTLEKLLPELGTETKGQFGQWCVATILRMFDVTQLRQSFESHGYTFGQIKGIRIPQRRFAGKDERDGVLKILHARGLDTARYEDDGRYYANLYIAAPPDQYHLLEERLHRL